MQFDNRESQQHCYDNQRTKTNLDIKNATTAREKLNQMPKKKGAAPPVKLFRDKYLQ